MKKTYEERLKSYTPQKITKFWSHLMQFLMGFLVRKLDVKYYYDFDVKAYKNKQVCLLADHASRNAVYLTICGYKDHDFNILCGYQNFYEKMMFFLFTHAGVIPKELYAPDMKAVKDMLRIVKDGGNLLIYPEGIQSTIGSTHPMNPATLKLIKKMDVDVLVCKSYGTYLANPRFASKFKKGPMEIHYDVLFTKEELETLSIEELYQKYLEKFCFNDFIWNKEKQYSYIGEKPNAEGFQYLFYKCPICGKEECIEVVDDKLVCKECGLEVRVDEKYNMFPNKKLPFERLDQWFHYQRECVNKEVLDPNFKMDLKAEYEMLDVHKLHGTDDKCYKVGEGRIVFTKENFIYTGTIKGENVVKVFDYKLTPSAAILVNKGIEFYNGQDFAQVAFPGHGVMSIKAVLAIEAIHNLSDPAWKACSDDVYHY